MTFWCTRNEISLIYVYFSALTAFLNSCVFVAYITDVLFERSNGTTCHFAYRPSVLTKSVRNNAIHCWTPFLLHPHRDTLSIVASCINRKLKTPDGTDRPFQALSHDTNKFRKLLIIRNVCSIVCRIFILARSDMGLSLTLSIGAIL